MSSGLRQAAVDLLVIAVGSGALAAMEAARVAEVRPAVVVVDTRLCDAHARQGVHKLMDREGYKAEAELGAALLFRRI